VTQLVSILNLNQGGFCQLPQNDRTYRSMFTLSAKFCLQESCLSDQFLEGRKLLGTFWSKGRKFYIIAFLTFLSQHFDQEREGFFVQSKHGSERELNLWPQSIYINGTSQQLQNLLLVAMRLWRLTFLFVDLFFTLFCSSLPFLTLCVYSLFDWSNTASK